MKFVPYALAAAAIMTIGATAQADRGRGGNQVVYAAQDVREAAEYLTETLARGGPANVQLIHNAGMTAKEANDLVSALQGRPVDGGRFANPDREYSDVLRAFRILRDNFRWQGRQGQIVQNAFNRLEYSVEDLTYAFEGGGSWGGDGRDGRDDGRDGRDGRDDGGDWGGDGQDDGNGDWGEVDSQDDGQDGNGDWGERR